jgi:hypothetical protein
MGAGGAERDAVLAGQREQAAARVGLADAGVVDVRAGAGADLDLRRDQLPRDRVRQHGIGRARVAQHLEARGELERRGVDERELLLDADGEVGRPLEGLARGDEVDHAWGAR